MFTGIVEETAKVISFEEKESAWRLVLEAHEVTRDLQMGDSIAVNGCCLTAVAFTEDRIEFDLLEESVRLTSIGSKRRLIACATLCTRAASRWMVFR
jgi:riboflavin synthase